MLKKYDYFFYLYKTYLPVQMHIQITMYKIYLLWQINELGISTDKFQQKLETLKLFEISYINLLQLL